MGYTDEPDPREPLFSLEALTVGVANAVHNYRTGPQIYGAVFISVVDRVQKGLIIFSTEGRFNVRDVLAMAMGRFDGGVLSVPRAKVTNSIEEAITNTQVDTLAGKSPSPSVATMSPLTFVVSDYKITNTTAPSNSRPEIDINFTGTTVRHEDFYDVLAYTYSL